MSWPGEKTEKVAWAGLGVVFLMLLMQAVTISAVHLGLLPYQEPLPKGEVLWSAKLPEGVYRITAPDGRDYILTYEKGGAVSVLK